MKLVYRKLLYERIYLLTKKSQSTHLIYQMIVSDWVNPGCIEKEAVRIK